MRNRLLIVTTLIFAVLLTGCTSASSNQETPSIVGKSLQETPISKDSIFNDVLIIATGDMSGVYFPLGQALAQIYEQKNKAKVGTQVTNASVDNMVLVSQKKADLGFATADVLDAAIMENPDSQRNISQLRALASIYSNYLQIVTTKTSGIHTFADLKGKRINVGQEGSGTRIMAERVLREANLTEKDYQSHTLSFSQSADALRNGSIDVAFFSSGLPNPELLKLSSEIPISLLAMPTELATKLEGKYDVYTKDVISKETYQGLAEDVHTVSVQNILLIHQDVSNIEAYRLVESLYSNLGDLQAIHSAANGINLSKAITDIPIKYHPGALTYYRKQGIIH
ncbi:TAXI family TRAP transporter solute-binding subunit [Bacillus massiliigorillae]|uniref:TAXI family TRAP transporter solute-binding subunit n=1 Tax=Bacillus massiliigorillae TaxID=1243664 RepID=UPI0003AA0596|nr:TAXI family TRAP transporter solute-binding subunit [Bacillus massiliigorillae]